MDRKKDCNWTATGPQKTGPVVVVALFWNKKTAKRLVHMDQLQPVATSFCTATGKTLVRIKNGA
jgi:hypothetical protein